MAILRATCFSSTLFDSFTPKDSHSPIDQSKPAVAVPKSPGGRWICISTATKSSVYQLFVSGSWIKVLELENLMSAIVLNSWEYSRISITNIF